MVTSLVHPHLYSSLSTLLSHWIAVLLDCLCPLSAANRFLI